MSVGALVAVGVFTVFVFEVVGSIVAVLITLVASSTFSYFWWRCSVPYLRSLRSGRGVSGMSQRAHGLGRLDDAPLTIAEWASRICGSVLSGLMALSCVLAVVGRLLSGW